MNASAGHRLIVPLGPPRACSAVEELQTSQQSSFAHRTKLSKAQSQCSSTFIATWNVRSPLECDGSLEIARQRTETFQLAEDQKIDLVVRELKR